jgi:hypothetical protein
MSEQKPACCSGNKEDEIFEFLGNAYVFNINLAKELVLDGREPVEVEEESVRYSVETSNLVEEHIAHVDPDRPGIIAHVSYTKSDGEIIRGHVLVDGNHRAARCMQLGRPFFAYILTPEESEQILLRRLPKGSIDWQILPAHEQAANPKAISS